MLNKITDEERDAQDTLGPVSWYTIFVMTDDKIWLRNYKDVSGKGVVQQFKNHFAQLAKEPPVHPTIIEILRDIDEGYYHVKILPWGIDDN